MSIVEHILSGGDQPEARRDGRIGRLLLHCVENDNGYGKCRLCRGWAHMGEPIRHGRTCPLPAACRALGYALPNINRAGQRTFKPLEKKLATKTARPGGHAL